MYQCGCAAVLALGIEPRRGRRDGLWLRLATDMDFRGLWDGLPLRDLRPSTGWNALDLHGRFGPSSRPVLCRSHRVQGLSQRGVRAGSFLLFTLLGCLALKERRASLLPLQSSGPSRCLLASHPACRCAALVCPAWAHRTVKVLVSPSRAAGPRKRPSPPPLRPWC